MTLSDDEDETLAHYLESEVLSEVSDQVSIFFNFDFYFNSSHVHIYMFVCLYVYRLG